MSDLERINNICKLLESHEADKKSFNRDLLDIEQKEKTKFFAPNKKECCLIKAGFTYSPFETEFKGKKVFARKFYPEDVLKKAAKDGLFNGVPMILRTDEEHLKQINNSVKNVAGWFTETKWNDANKSVEGVFNIRTNRKKELEKRWNYGIELSIAGRADYELEFQQILNEVIATITLIREIKSVDAVTVANARGKML